MERLDPDDVREWGELSADERRKFALTAEWLLVVGVKDVGVFYSLWGLPTITSNTGSGQSNGLDASNA